MNDELLKMMGYVISSNYRLKCLKAIGESVKTPTNISKDSGIRIFHISNVLRQLKENDLAECINEEKRKGRLYRLTDKGKKVLNMIENM